MAEKAYSNSGLSQIARERHTFNEERESISNFENNNQTGTSVRQAEVRPMASATRRGTYSVHSTGVFRAYIDGLHDSFIPKPESMIDAGRSDESLKKAAICNDLCGIYNTNSPGAGEPVASHGGKVQMETFVTTPTNRKGGIGKTSQGVNGGLRGVVNYNHGTDSPYIGLGGGRLSKDSYTPGGDGRTRPPPPVATAVSNGQKISGALNFTWEQLKQLAALGIFEPVLKNIRDHECSLGGCATRNFEGNQYDAYNYDGGYKIGKTEFLDKGLSQYNIAEVTTHWQATNSLKGYKMFATGAYQIIPKTFKKAIDRIANLDTSEAFNQLNQDALGIYLVTMKRKNLGKYMFGDTEVTAARAGNELAFEFASIRLQADAQRDGQTIPAFTKYYGGVGANKQGTEDPNDAAKTMAAINQVRQNIDNSSVAQALKQEALK